MHVTEKLSAGFVQLEPIALVNFQVPTIDAAGVFVVDGATVGSSLLLQEIRNTRTITLSILEQTTIASLVSSASNLE